MADIEKLAEDLSALTVLEAAELAKLLEDKWGVSAAAAGMAARARRRNSPCCRAGCDCFRRQRRRPMRRASAFGCA